MKIAIHQPNFLPYIGFFQKINLADVTVLLDHVQFSKQSYTQRVKIYSPIKDYDWITLPIKKEYHFLPINQVKIDTSEHNKIKNKIKNAYSNKEFFDKNILDSIFIDERNLARFNEHGIKFFCDIYNINTTFIRSSNLDIDFSQNKNSLLIDIIKNLGGKEYISGSGGKNYMEEDLFIQNDIKIQYHDYIPNQYVKDCFIPYLSILDLYFNCGLDGEKYIKT